MNKNALTSLLTLKEQSLLDSSQGDRIQFHQPERIKKLIELVRKLRDKYRDLNHRQINAQFGSTNIRTVKKIQIFENMLERFEHQSEILKARNLRKNLKLEQGLSTINLSPESRTHLQPDPLLRGWAEPNQPQANQLQPNPGQSNKMLGTPKLFAELSLVEPHAGVEAAPSNATPE